MTTSERRHGRWEHGLNRAAVWDATRRACRTLPDPLVRMLSRRVVMPAARALLPEVRRALEANLEPVVSNPRARRHLARRTFVRYGEVVVDLLRVVSGAESGRVETLLEEPGGWRRIADAAGGGGAILVSPHLGNWELGALALRRAGLPVRIVALPEADAELQSFRVEARRVGGVETIPVGSSLSSFLRVRSALGAGGFVALLCERHFEEDRCRVRFFGRDALFLRTPGLLAASSGRPLLPVAFVRVGSRYRLLLGEPVHPRSVGEPSVDEEAESAMQRVAAAFEGFLREHPDQWFNFFPYWPASAA